MGCGGTKVLENEKFIRFELRLKASVKEKILDNPFYNVPKIKMDEIIGKHKNNDMSIICSQLNDILMIKPLTFSLASDVLKFAREKLDKVYPVEMIDYNIVMTLYYFLTKQDKIIEAAKMALMESLIITTKKPEKTKGDPVYLSGKLSYLIYNILQFALFAFVSLFVGISVIEISDGCTIDELSKLFVEKKESGDLKPSTLDSYINDQLKNINPHISPYNILSKCLAEIFQPIADVVMKNPNLEETKISNDTMKDIISRLCHCLNVVYFLDVFLIR